jgi:unconventional prefoldin RPB5 interactor 1
MEKELSIIDGILANLAGIQAFYEFESEQLNRTLVLLKKFQKETIGKELAESHDVYKKETDKEIAKTESKIEEVMKKIKQIESDIKSRAESRQKLISLFNSLKSIDSLDSLGSSSHGTTGSPEEKGAPGEFCAEDDLPIMEIREELADDETVIRSEVKPYSSPEEQLKKLMQNKRNFVGSSESTKDIVTRKKISEIKDQEVDQDGNVITSSFRLLGKKEQKTADKKVTKDKAADMPLPVKDEKDASQEENFRPFVIREEIDEDGNTIKSSMSRIPQMQPSSNDADSKSSPGSIAELPANPPSEEVEEDLLEELFEDMGFKLPKEAKKEEQVNKKTEVEHVPLKNGDERKQTQKPVSINIPETLSVGQEDIYTLEMIAGELTEADANSESEMDFEVTGDMEEYDLPEIGTLNGNTAQKEINKAVEEEEDDHEEEEEEDDDGGEDDTDDDGVVQERVLSNMFGSKGKDMFAERIMQLRSKGTEKSSQLFDDVKVEAVGDVVDRTESIKIIESSPQPSVVSTSTASTKPKKSVSFNSTVAVKNVSDIWDDLRKSNAENTLLSERVEDTRTKKERDGVNVISDVFERQVVENGAKVHISSHHNVFKTFDPIMIRKEVDANMADISQRETLIKLSGKKAPSRFKLARAAEQGKQFQATHIPVEVRSQLQAMAMNIPAKSSSTEKEMGPVRKELKANLNSLQPPRAPHKQQSMEDKKPIVIEAPKDINPLPVNPSLADEDYEIVRNEVNDDLFDDDDEMVENEFVSSGVIVDDEIRGEQSAKLARVDQQSEKSSEEYFPDYTPKGNKSERTEEVIGTTLDYKTLGNDMDTMAKAYVLGLYDDDVETSGQVIEELDDFESHNKIVEQRDESHLHDRVNEINKKFEDPDGKIEEILEDGNPMVLSDIVENDLDEVLRANSIPDDQLDIELNDETLTTQVALDYTKMRSNMIHKYNGGFRETDKEKEFVRPEGSERISRFKMARLGI